METATEQGRQVRQRLCGAAVELIAERGWSAVSTRALADRAGVTPGLVHYHYASVSALLREAAIGVISAVAHDLSAHLDTRTTLTAGIDGLLAELDTYPGDDPTSQLFLEAVLAATRDAELHRSIAEILGRFRDTLTGWLEAHGVAEPAATAGVLAAAIDGMMLHRATNPQLTAPAAASVLRRLVTSHLAQPTEEPE
ncbi:TetR/AcrR family transcriptional regulator [Lipingzhangella sp. LS1_29]|uniref:TetR/AcrR family transcriptional regulator n=1 Tax=Lipingzhangella rawalii TaxID=2055835 RepID=A0ABU2H909_9ACTN|nr:TetR/AcrR family transcriptional regulator [Lipingzhangella rawalii]MDS1271792.1 TetR/AcrR family transcriptional regulator [Lipingzhangella rawalii]